MRWTKASISALHHTVLVSRMWHDRWEAVARVMDKHYHDEVCEDGDEAITPEACMLEAEGRGWLQ